MPNVILDYRKDRTHPPGHGYGRNVGTDEHPIWLATRPGPVSSCIVHSTNGHAGSSLEAEAAFLRDSPNVSAHDIIGKDGTIVELLPVAMEAWHAGKTKAPWLNFRSLGIELHHAIGESYTPAQIDALTWRVKQRIEQFSIPKERIDTHRAVALPPGRKVDPSDWSNADFYAWRDGLYQEVQTLSYYRVTSTVGVRVRTQPNTSAASQTVRILRPGEVVGVSEIIQGETVDGVREWAHIGDNTGFTTMRWLVPA